MSEIFVVDDLTFEVRRSERRKTVGITVDRGGELILAVPHGCSSDTLRRTVNERRFWIYTKLAQKEMLLRPGRKKEFVTGEGFLYLGRSYRLRLLEGTDGVAPLRLHHGWFMLDKGEQENARAHFIRWYMDHGHPWLYRRVHLLKDQIGAEPTGINVRDLGSRWGSCGRRGTLNFHWRTILLPPPIIEYIVAHELIHLRESYHTPDFWRRLERAIPDYVSRKQWLAENGATADI